MGRIPEETVTQVIAATNLVELIGHHVRLKKMGAQYRGLCPFHHEKTPSFYVNPLRNSYHCFGCGEGGTAAGFVMKMENLTFPEAIRQLAQRAGISIQEEEDSPEAARERSLRDRLLSLHTALAEWYHQLLWKSPEAAEAREYLQSRGLEQGTIDAWQMGYAPASANSLMEWARKNRYESGLLETGGILYAPDEERPGPARAAARFRDRLMFPIANEFAQIVGFSGRVLRGDGKGAKYLNSPETPIFRKSHLLFGMDKAKRAVLRDRRAVLCEGQIDTIAAVEAGVKNAVAPLGTAFTEFHARMLRRHADEVILCFDGDAAGQKAALRAYEIMAPEGILVRLVDLPAGEDPDSLIKKEGAERFSERVESARDFHEALMIQGLKSEENRDLRGRVRFAEKIAFALALMPDPIARDAAAHAAAVRLGLGVGDLQKLIERAVRERLRDQSRDASYRDRAEDTGPAHPTLPAQNRVSLDLCRLLLVDEEAREWSAQVDFSPFTRELPGTELLASLVEKPLPVGQAEMLAFVSASEPPLPSEYGRLLSSPAPTSGAEEGRLLVKKLELERLTHLRSAMDTRLKAPGLDPHSMLELLEEVSALSRMIDEVRHAVRQVNQA